MFGFKITIKLNETTNQDLNKAAGAFLKCFERSSSMMQTVLHFNRI
jgi:hypothetical protein